MKKIDVSAEIYRIRRQYPELWYFMEAHWNERFDDFYSTIADAANEFAQECPEFMTRNLLAQVKRARKDEALRALMDDLASLWCGMALEDECFAELTATLEERVRELGPAVVPLRRA